MRFKAKTMVAVLLTFIVGCRASSPEDSKRTLSLIPSDRVVQKSITRQCNQGGQSNVPVVKSGPIQCPCFFEWRFYPDKESLWNIFVIPEAAFLAWRDRQYTGRPARYLAEYSDLSLKGVSGKVVARPKTNIMSVDKLVVAFQSKSETTVCMGTASFESSTTATESRNSFLVFESMPEECPVVVPNPPVRIGSRKAPVAVEHRVVGGSLAAADNGLATYFPWIAIIWLGTSRSICGGSHIAPGFILTAAHCRIQDSVDSFNVRIGNEEYDEGERFFIKRMWVHEKYRLLTNGEALYDIAIIEISDRNTSKDGDLIALNKNPDRPEAGDYLTTAGYGHLAEDWPKPLDPNPLRKVDVPMWDIEDCQNKFPAVSPTLHICAGKGGCDSCQADSGGPLRYLVNDSDGNITGEVLAGLVSFGAGCAKSFYPGVYTKIATFAPWINDVVGGDRSIAPTTVASTKPEILSSVWGISLLALGGLVAILVVVAVAVALGKNRGDSGPEQMEPGDHESNGPSSSGIST